MLPMNSCGIGHSICSQAAGQRQSSGWRFRRLTMEAFGHDGFEVAERKADLFQRSDVLGLHVQLMKETRGIVTVADLAMMKPPSQLVNTSRAGLIKRGALEQALLTGNPDSPP